MTRKPAAKGGRASARSSAEAAPQDRLDRLEKMLEALIVQGSVAVQMVPAETFNAPTEEDEPEDKIDRAAELAKRREREAHEDEVAAQVVDTLIDPRHLQILDWLARLQGKRQAQILKEILRSALIRERPAYREAHGGGGNSSRDAGALAERLPGRK